MDATPFSNSFWNFSLGNLIAWIGVLIPVLHTLRRMHAENKAKIEQQVKLQVEAARRQEEEKVHRQILTNKVDIVYNWVQQNGDEIVKMRSMFLLIWEWYKQNVIEKKDGGWRE